MHQSLASPPPPVRVLNRRNLAQTQVNVENGSVNTLKFVDCFHFHFKAFDDYIT